MAIGINQLAAGMALNVEGDFYIVNEYNHVKPGKGAAFCRVKMRNVKTGASLERTYRTSDRLEDVPMDEQRLEFLYYIGDVYHFMNHETYEQVEVDKGMLAGVEKFLLENLEVVGLIHEHKILKIILPNFIEAEIIESEPGIKGDSSRSGNKPAKIQTEAVIHVPLFINQGDWIKIDTRTSQYVERIQR